MTRILFMGSSHLGALKLGWDRIASDFPGLEVGFFGAPAGVFWRMRAERDGTFGAPEGTLSPSELERVERLFGRTRVDLTEYDAIAVAGWRIEEIYNADILRTYSVARLAPHDALPPMSFETYLRFVDAYLSTLLPEDHWRTVATDSLYFIAKPRMAAGCEAGTTTRTKVWADLIRAKATSAEMLDVYVDRAKAAFESAGFRLLSAPREVLAPNGLTRREFSRAAAPDASGGRSGDDFDFSHMNAAYGAVVARSVMQRMIADI